MAHYYNEFDPFAARWLRNLIAAGLLPAGDVDDRSIMEVTADDIRGYTQCHFFAGIGGWALALRMAGWPDTRPVWTGSCPCQPFSAAGKGQGFADERHLWPVWLDLIRKCGPVAVFGEQVEAAINHGWLDTVQTDLENCGYAVGACSTPAAGVGAPHIRPRLWFVAHPYGQRLEPAPVGGIRTYAKHDPESYGPADGMGNTHGAGLEGLRSGHQAESGRESPVRSVTQAGQSGALANADNGRVQTQGRQPIRGNGQSGAGKADFRPGPVNGHWLDADWLRCRDGRWRPVEPSRFPLANGVPDRVGRLRAYGNAIAPPLAAEFIAAYMEYSPP